MSNWESKGQGFSIHKLPPCTDPKLLCDYVQGKVSRDWHITEWKRGCREGLFHPEEFLGYLGCDEKEFRGIFGRDPKPHLVELLRPLHWRWVDGQPIHD